MAWYCVCVCASECATDVTHKGLPENYAPLLVENIKKGGFTHVVASHSAFGKNVLPRVAAMMDAQPVSDVTAIEGEDSTLPIPNHLRPRLRRLQ